MTVTTLAAALPQRQPEDPAPRLLLFAVRQMGAHGLHDAAAAHAFMTGFGKDFRRPLTLTRALVAEISAASSGPIQIAPWCCPRMTASEAALLAVMARAQDNREAAGMLLADLLGVRDARGVLITARAVARAFADLGLPL